MAEAIAQHLEGLAKELSCSICLSVMENPVARLRCCHYFCKGCISESVRHAGKCPVCKTKITRRDIAEDPTMDRVVTAFRNLQDHEDDLVAVGAGAAPAAPAIPWLQGVDDDDFRSLSRSLSGTALENLRRVNKRGRSKSPATVHKPPTRTADTADEVDKKKANSTKKSGSRKRSDVSMSQGIQKFFKMDASGNKTPALYTTAAGTDAAVEEEDNQERVAESPTMSASLLMGAKVGAAAAARQLDDIVAGLDSEEPTPSEQQPRTAPTMTNSLTAALFDAKHENAGKENKKNGGKKQRGNVGASGNKKAAKKTEQHVVEEEQEAPDSSGRRRIPTRLVPWNCSVCTFENKGGEHKCQMCQTVKGAETPPPAQQNFPAVAEASPAAAAAAAGLTTGKNAANRPLKKRTATNANQSAHAPEKQQQQKKMTAVKQAGARGRTTINSTAQKEKSAAATTAVETTTSQDTQNADAGGSCGWTDGATSSKWVLLGSGLDSLGKEQLRSLGALSGATIAEKWNPRVTHVICGAGGANAAYLGEKTARRTFKYLMGVLHGRWVLTQEWVNAQLSSKKKVDEVAYQVEKDGVGCACGAAASKAAAMAAGCNASTNSASTSHLLFRGFEVQLQGDFANKSQMIELIKAAGGKVVSRLPTIGAKNMKNKRTAAEVGGVVLVEVPDTSEAVAAGFKAAIVSQTWFTKAVETGVPVASHRWLTDSISRFQLSPLDKFLIG